jgi:hypothetical protein
VYGPEAIRRICERLARERDDARCHELIAQLRLVVDEDREELSDRLQFLASRLLRRGSGERRNIVEHGNRTAREGRQGLIIVVLGNPSERQASQE